jgi:hypothetical protein
VCHTSDSWSAALLLVFFLTVPAHAVLQLRFLKQLELRHPAVWEELTGRKAWGDESSATYSTSLWYLLGGGYRSLRDSTLAASALLARRAAGVSIVALASWAVFVALTQASPSFDCLH